MHPSTCIHRPVDGSTACRWIDSLSIDSLSMDRRHGPPAWLTTMHTRMPARLQYWRVPADKRTGRCAPAAAFASEWLSARTAYVRVTVTSVTPRDRNNLGIRVLSGDFEGYPDDSNIFVPILSNFVMVVTTFLMVVTTPEVLSVPYIYFITVGPRKKL